MFIKVYGMSIKILFSIQKCFITFIRVGFSRIITFSYKLRLQQSLIRSVNCYVNPLHLEKPMHAQSHIVIDVDGIYSLMCDTHPYLICTIADSIVCNIYLQTLREIFNNTLYTVEYMLYIKVACHTP